jgi:hypothetical protein
MLPYQENQPLIIRSRRGSLAPAQRIARMIS